MQDVTAILTALSAIRIPDAQPEEYAIHRAIAEALAKAQLPCEHEARLAPRCRVDFLCGTVGLEIKKSRPPRKALLAQCEKYLASDRLSALILISPRALTVPAHLCGKPLYVFSLNRLWGVALP